MNTLLKENLPPTKVFIGLPVYGGYDPHFTGCLINLLMNPPVSVVMKSNIGDSLVSRARNNLVADFLKTDCTHLLFIDTDLIFSAEHVTRLLSHNVPLVAGVYPKKQAELAWVFNPIPGEVEDKNGLIKVKYAATGFMLIRRDLIEAMISVFRCVEYDDDEGGGVKHDLFSVGVVDRRYLSEDWYFCRRARILGIDVLIDTRVVLKHVGKAIYPISPDAYEPA
jgi:hypothetical protein